MEEDGREGGAKEEDVSSIDLMVVFAGQGQETPTNGDVVLMHYTIAIENEPDHIIENSRERHRTHDKMNSKGAPFSFIMGQDQVIEGWEIAVSQMKKGEVADLVLTPSLAYGYLPEDELFGEYIPREASLQFRIELVDFFRYDDGVCRM